MYSSFLRTVEVLGDRRSPGRFFGWGGLGCGRRENGALKIAHPAYVAEADFRRPDLALVRPAGEGAEVERELAMELLSRMLGVGDVETGDEGLDEIRFLERRLGFRFGVLP